MLTTFTCKKCGENVRVDGDQIVRTCGHDQDGVLASVSATAVRGESTIAGDVRHSRIRAFVAWLRSVAT